jgi:hypothetical protein
MKPNIVLTGRVVRSKRREKQLHAQAVGRCAPLVADARAHDNFSFLRQRGERKFDYPNHMTLCNVTRISHLMLLKKGTRV